MRLRGQVPCGVVLFELPTFADTEAFSARLRSRWPGWSDVEEGVWLFTAELRGGDGELARLLRDAQDSSPSSG